MKTEIEYINTWSEHVTKTLNKEGLSIIDIINIYRLAQDLNLTVPDFGEFITTNYTPEYDKDLNFIGYNANY